MTFLNVDARIGVGINDVMPLKHVIKPQTTHTHTQIQLLQFQEWDHQRSHRLNRRNWLFGPIIRRQENAIICSLPIFNMTHAYAYTSNNRVIQHILHKEEKERNSIQMLTRGNPLSRERDSPKSCQPKNAESRAVKSKLGKNGIVVCVRIEIPWGFGILPRPLCHQHFYPGDIARLEPCIQPGSARPA